MTGRGRRLLAALGMLAWCVGHWSFAVRNDARYRSPLARAVIDRTLPAVEQYWNLRKRRPAND